MRVCGVCRLRLPFRTYYNVRKFVRHSRRHDRSQKGLHIPHEEGPLVMKINGGEHNLITKHKLHVIGETIFLSNLILLIYLL